MEKTGRIDTDIVLVGGGHAHVEVIRKWAMSPVPSVRLTLVARDVATPYTGMLPGLIAGIYSVAETHIDLQKLCRHARVRLVHAPATGIDPEAQRLAIEGRPALAYDLLSIDTGSTPYLGDIAGAAGRVIGVKPVDRFLRWLEGMDAAPAAGETICIIGGGAGGTELALALAWRFHGKYRLALVSAGSDIVPEHNPGVRRALGNALTDAGVDLRRNRRVVAVDDAGVTLDDGNRVDARHVIATTRAAAPTWLGATGLTLDDNGFIAIDDCLQSISHPEVFAAGDVASMINHDLPKAGVYAVRQGPVLAESLRRVAKGLAPEPYRPQPRALALISTGKPHAVASWGPFAVAGDWVWRWKDWIDRRWMQVYQETEPMPEPVDEATGETLMRCGGCGAKVSDLALKAAIAELRRTAPDGIGDLDDDAAIITPPPGKVIVQSVDQFRAMIDDPWLFGRIAAEHCLSDLHAMGAIPHGALATVTLPDGAPEALASELAQVLSGAVDTLRRAGAKLLGGHTSEGAELTLGLTVTGFGDAGILTRKGGALPGDRLILTKPLGTGAILAADMRGKASAGHVEAAIQSMLQSNGPAAAILTAWGARAVTDVTGFGLAGHLIEMMRASGASAEIDLAALPALPGFREAEAAGILSTMHPKNLAYAALFDGEPDAILFDPQTSGGLLASLPGEHADACLKEFISGGLTAELIGRVTVQGNYTMVIR
jgi:selenide,water dikinase